MGIKEDIQSLAEASTYDFRTVLHEEDTGFVERNGLEVLLKYYHLKAAIVSYIRPETILEIGVRGGYSSAAFLHSTPTAKLVGVDINKKKDGGKKGMIKHAMKRLPELYPEATIAFHIKNSQKKSTGDFLRKNYGSFDFIHVDGDHTVKGCVNDLHMAMGLIGPAGHILVDDIYYIEDVREAVDKFSSESGLKWVEIPSLRGEALFAA